jgi:hypothetical protein
MGIKQMVRNIFIIPSFDPVSINQRASDEQVSFLPE